MPESGIKKLDHSDILTVEEIAEIMKAAALCGITKVRITGGEPLVRRGIIEICKTVSETAGINDICLTTNGTLLPKFAPQLKSAGVNRLNISLDSLDIIKYNEITRTGTLNEALAGIDAAFEAGFDTIKINTVLIGGMNESSIPEMIELTRKKNIDVRFIELMPIGERSGWAKSRFIKAQCVLQAVPDLIEAGTDGVAKLYKLPDGIGTVGLITPISSHFCPTCNRIRITPNGTLKPCLHSPEEINLRGLHGPELEETIRSAIYKKPKKHELNDKKSSQKRNMNEIGG